MHRDKGPLSISQIVLSMLLAILLLAPSQVNAQRTAGVQVNDWADYTVTYQGNSTELMRGELLNVTRMTLNVTNSLGTNVTFQGHAYFENGTDIMEEGWIDVDTGEVGGGFAGEGILIAANLSEDDRIYTANTALFGEGTINETITREYLGSMVEVNHFMRNMTISSSWVNMTFYMSFYWYRETGLPAEMTVYYEQETSGLPEFPGAFTVSSNMTWFEINMLIVDFIPEFPAFTLVPLVIFATIAIATLVKIQAKHQKLAYVLP